MLSWIVFWMERDDIGNRMALGITTILTIMFLLGSLNGNLPKVSYPKALDWYLLVSFSFVFLSLIECMIVYVFTVKAKQDKEQIKFKVTSLWCVTWFQIKKEFLIKTLSFSFKTILICLQLLSSLGIFLACLIHLAKKKIKKRNKGSGWVEMEKIWTLKQIFKPDEVQTELANFWWTWFSRGGSKKSYKG